MNNLPIDENSCPIFAKKDGFLQFIGSAFLFRRENDIYVATANHVVAGHAGHAFEVATKSGSIGVEILLQNPALDLCLLRPLDSLSDVRMVLSEDKDKPGNLPLYVYEFSTTSIEDGKFRINPATRIGNCVRLIQREGVFGLAGCDMLELSFPALKGASGSAVVEIRGTELMVLGVVVANTEHHLLPAQIETVLDINNEILEERKYFLPQAAAVNSIHLVSMIEKLKSEAPSAT